MLPGQGGRVGDQIGRRALENDESAVVACSGSDVEMRSCLSAGRSAASVLLDVLIMTPLA